MSFAEEYVAQLERFAARSPLPRVRTLHLPPKAIPGADNKGEFCALELEDGSLGLSFVLIGDTLEQLRAARDGFGLAGADAVALARPQLPCSVPRYLDSRTGWGPIVAVPQQCSDVV